MNKLFNYREFVYASRHRKFRKNTRYLQGFCRKPTYIIQNVRSCSFFYFMLENILLYHITFGNLQDEQLLFLRGFKKIDK